MHGLLIVLPVGIEPTLQAPQACVLSIERRELARMIAKVYFCSSFERRFRKLCLQGANVRTLISSQIFYPRFIRATLPQALLTGSESLSNRIFYFLHTKKDMQDFNNTLNPKNFQYAIRKTFVDVFKGYHCSKMCIDLVNVFFRYVHHDQRK